MHRLIGLLLLLLLPLQFGWAAAAAYCGHEASAGDCGFAHHQHQHEAAAVPVETTLAAPIETAEPATAAMATVPGLDADCGQCHFSTVKLLVPATEPGPVVDGRAAPVPSTVILAGRPNDRLERPKWSLA